MAFLFKKFKTDYTTEYRFMGIKWSRVNVAVFHSKFDELKHKANSADERIVKLTADNLKSNHELYVALDQVNQHLIQSCDSIKDQTTSSERIIKEDIEAILKSISYPDRPNHHDIKKWALMNYNYTGGDDYYINVYNAEFEVNIGDYIQSLAAKQFLPQVDTYIPRDEIAHYQGDDVGMIMNGWWWAFQGTKTLPETIHPLFISYHLYNPEDLSPDTLAYLKKYEPIGCRDLKTQRSLLKLGIKAYFSGCLTMTLGQTYHRAPREGARVIIADCDLEGLPAVKELLIQEYGDTYDFEQAEHVTHIYDMTLTHSERFEIADRLLKKYCEAPLVVTSRLHCALPCLSIGTPVLFVTNPYDPKRFEGLIDLVNHLGLNDKQELQSCILDSVDPVSGKKHIINPSRHLIFQAQLINRLKSYCY